MSQLTRTLLGVLALASGSIAAASTTQIFLQIQPDDERYERDRKERVFGDSRIKIGDRAWTAIRKLKTKGATCIGSVRKCFSVELEGHVPFTDADGDRVSLSHFDLLSMREDLGYSSVDLGRQFFAAIGVFPLKGGYVELVVNDHSKGLYYLLESPKQYLVDREGAVFGSRGSGPINTFKTSFYEKDKAPHAEQEYKEARDEIVTLARRLKDDGDQLYRALESRMDIDTYLRYQILNSLLRNGDFADEVFWYAKAANKGDPIYFRMMAWDLESLFKKPHWFPQNTILWRHRIEKTFFYSMETKLDRRLSRVDYVLRRMATTAQTMLVSTFTPAFIAKTFDATEQRLLPYAESRVLAPSVQDSGRETPYTKDELLQLLKAKKALLLERRLELLAKAERILARSEDAGSIPAAATRRDSPDWNYLSGMRTWIQSPIREAEGSSRLHNTITDWPDSGYTRRIPFIPGATPPWP